MGQFSIYVYKSTSSDFWFSSFILYLICTHLLRCRFNVITIVLAMGAAVVARRSIVYNIYSLRVDVYLNSYFRSLRLAMAVIVGKDHEWGNPPFMFTNVQFAIFGSLRSYCISFVPFTTMQVQCHYHCPCDGGSCGCSSQHRIQYILPPG